VKPLRRYSSAFLTNSLTLSLPFCGPSGNKNNHTTSMDQSLLRQQFNEEIKYVEELEEKERRQNEQRQQEVKDIEATIRRLTEQLANHEMRYYYYPYADANEQQAFKNAYTFLQTAIFWIMIALKAASIWGFNNKPYRR
jgi:septal ring factor EnvC (AmiA/AmiB activator)